MLRSIAKPFTLLVERFCPDPFVFAIFMSLLAFLLALLLTDSSPTIFGDSLLLIGSG